MQSILRYCARVLSKIVSVCQRSFSLPWQILLQLFWIAEDEMFIMEVICLGNYLADRIRSCGKRNTMQSVLLSLKYKAVIKGRSKILQDRLHPQDVLFACRIKPKSSFGRKIIYSSKS